MIKAITSERVIFPSAQRFTPLTASDRVTSPHGILSPGILQGQRVEEVVEEDVVLVEVVALVEVEELVEAVVEDVVLDGVVVVVEMCVLLEELVDVVEVEDVEEVLVVET